MDRDLLEILAREAGACSVEDVLVDRCDEALCLYPEQLSVLASLFGEQAAQRCDEIAARDLSAMTPRQVAEYLAAAIRRMFRP